MILLLLIKHYTIKRKIVRCYFLQHSTGWNAKIVVIKKTTLQLYFKTFIEKIKPGNLIM